MDQINEKNLTSFFGNVPTPMELSFLGLALGAPMQYRTDKNTGLDEVCMLVPQKSGGVQPVIVTLGNSDSIANGARSAIYHSFNLDTIINESKVDKKNCELLSQKFTAIASNMGPSNDYVKKFLEPKSAELREKLIKYYPEQISDFDAVLDSYKAAFANAFGSTNVAAENDDKKKQITM